MTGTKSDVYDCLVEAIRLVLGAHIVCVLMSGIEITLRALPWQ